MRHNNAVPSDNHTQWCEDLENYSFEEPFKQNRQNGEDNRNSNRPQNSIRRNTNYNFNIMLSVITEVESCVHVQKSHPTSILHRSQLATERIHKCHWSRKRSDSVTSIETLPEKV